MSDEEVAQALPRELEALTPNTITKREALIQELHKSGTKAMPSLLQRTRRRPLCGGTSSPGRGGCAGGHRLRKRTRAAAESEDLPETIDQLRAASRDIAKALLGTTRGNAIGSPGRLTPPTAAGEPSRSCRSRLEPSRGDAPRTDTSSARTGPALLRARPPGCALLLAVPRRRRLPDAARVLRVLRASRSRSRSAGLCGASASACGANWAWSYRKVGNSASP